MLAPLKAKRKEGEPNYPIGSVDRALRLIVLFRTRKILRLSDVADELGVARSTAHRLMAMLEFYDFAIQDPVTRLYEAGPSLVDVGLSAVVGMDIRTAARPALLELSEALGETVNLVILRARKAITIDSIEGDRAVRIGSRAGKTLPAHCTAAGKASLAMLPPETFSELYSEERLMGLTKSSIRSRAALKQALAKVRSRGFATNFGESEVGVNSVGAAIVDRLGNLRGAFSVSVPASRLRPREVEALAGPLMRQAKRFGRSLA